MSITIGDPRKHVWTYAAGLSDDFHNFKVHNCPCARHPGPRSPSFVGNDYYCESGNTNTFDKNKLYDEDPLWDGDGCLSGNRCCQRHGMPWFHRDFQASQSGDIEVRICKDQTFPDEGVAVEQIQLYVQ